MHNWPLQSNSQYKPQHISATFNWYLFNLKKLSHENFLENSIINMTKQKILIETVRN